MEALRNHGLVTRGADFIYSRVLRGGGFAELADKVLNGQHSLGDAALQDTVEFEPIKPWEVHGLRLCEPAEHGFKRDPDYQPPEAA